MNVITTETVKAEGARHARIALSQGAEYGTIEATICAYRDNLIDTFNDEGLASWSWVAIEGYDSVIDAQA